MHCIKTAELYELMLTEAEQSIFLSQFRCWKEHDECTCSGMKDRNANIHYSDVIMGAMASGITSLTIVYSNVYSGADQRKHQSFASLAFVRWIHRWSVNSPHKWPVTREIFPFDDVIMHHIISSLSCVSSNEHTPHIFRIPHEQVIAFDLHPPPLVPTDHI